MKRDLKHYEAINIFNIRMMGILHKTWKLVAGKAEKENRKRGIKLKKYKFSKKITLVIEKKRVHCNGGRIGGIINNQVQYQAVQNVKKVVGRKKLTTSSGPTTYQIRITKNKKKRKGKLLIRLKNNVVDDEMEDYDEDQPAKKKRKIEAKTVNKNKQENSNKS